MRSTLGAPLWRHPAARAVGVAVVLFTLHAGDAHGSRISCKRATTEAAQTRVVMSNATRAADAKRAAFHACAERRKSNPRACQALRKAMRNASREKRNAVAAFEFAIATKTKVCNQSK